MTWIDIIIYASFLLTPLGGLGGFQLLLRTGWFTNGTIERDVPFFSTTAEYYTFKSRTHKRAAWIIGFLGGWTLTTVLYVFFLDTVYFTGSS